MSQSTEIHIPIRFILKHHADFIKCCGIIKNLSVLSKVVQQRLVGHVGNVAVQRRFPKKLCDHDKSHCKRIDTVQIEAVKKSRHKSRPFGVMTLLCILG